MQRASHRHLVLTEYQPLRLPHTELDWAVGETIWRRYPRQVAVDFPSIKTADHWQITSLGWIGVLPVSPALTLVLQPKTPLRTLWSILAYAFDLADLLTGADLVGLATLPDFYDRLARLLADRILARCQRGLDQSYLPKVERLPAIRGRIDLADALRSPWQPLPLCRYEEQTPDTEENQILLWTLDRLRRSGFCSKLTLERARRAYDLLSSAVTLRAVSAAACHGRNYTRLNADYRQLHAFCYFFLAQVAPALAAGDVVMQPFCLHMATLYERFVAAWLSQNIDRAWHVKAQEHYHFGNENEVTFSIDLIIRDRALERVRWVLDTKYKTAVAAAPEDIAQVVAYAEATDAPEAVLVYPAPLVRPLDVRIGRVRVRSLSFALDRHHDLAGAEFLERLGANPDHSAAVSVHK